MPRFLFLSLLLTATSLLASPQASDSLRTATPPVIHSRIGESVTSPDGSITLKCVAKKQAYAPVGSPSRDTDIYSPKSVSFHPDGRKYYVNSLEGCRTIAYDALTNRKLKVINHRFKSGKGKLWGTPSPYYPFTHYPDGLDKSFAGKPVESAFCKNGRYLLVPYYRRTFDINAQDPSALAVIDTRSDSIVRMLETGPLPKMVAVSNDARTGAVTHWGDNTVGLIDISDNDPSRWRHRAPVAAGRKLKLDFSLTEKVDRDSDSGNLLRGTIFLPGDSILLVSGMASAISVINPRTGKYIGTINDLWSVRHLIISNGWLYCSRNVAGDVWRVPVKNILSSISASKGRKSFSVKGWERCKVGRGARTIESSPDGRFIFAACNGASRLVVIDTAGGKMRKVAEINVDSYPVGLDVSTDGRRVILTSQGRNGRGGNAVNIFSVTRP